MKFISGLAPALLVLLAACGQSPPAATPEVVGASQAGTLAPLALDCTAFTNGRIYVNAAASGANDGTTWSGAYPRLQDALAAARHCTGITEIWVAQGTYSPDEGGSASDNDRLAAFRMKNDLGIYGGFAGTETQRAQRDWAAHLTLLSGEIQQDNDPSNNSLNVVANLFTDSDRLTSSAVLDGFTVTGGRADGTRTLPILSGSGNFGVFGGGMINLYASPSVVNTIFTGNSAQYGGGLAFYYSFDGARLVNVTVRDNAASMNGGGIHFFQTFDRGAGYPQSMAATNLTVANNVAGYGGGIQIADSSIQLKNVVVANNRASGSGSQGQAGGIGSSGSTLIVTSGTVFGNTASVRGGGIVFSQDLPTQFVITNAVIWGNRTDAGDISSVVGPANPVSYSDIELASGVATGTGNLNADPGFANSADPDGGDDTWMTADDGLRLRPASPTVNSGTSSGGSPLSDVLGILRSPPFDMGAYEFVPLSCAAGTYSTGSACVPADPGYFVAAAGASAQTPCVVGTYQPQSGAVACLPAGAGHFVDVVAATAQTPCLVGTYQPATGQSGCQTASPGSFVATQGAAQQTECPPGRYQPASGASSCLLASAGSFVPTSGATAQMPCPAGSTSDAGAAACRPIDTTPPVITPSLSGTQGANGWYTSAVTVSWTISDPESPPMPATCASTTLSADTAGTTLSCSASSLGGSTTRTVSVKIDRTAPTCTVSATPDTLWSPNHKLANVTTTLRLSDPTSSFVLLGVTSSEADSRLGSDDVAGDIQGWTLNTPDTAGQLRNERYSKAGRTYTLNYGVSDPAGNTTRCAATVRVLASQK